MIIKSLILDKIKREASMRPYYSTDIVRFNGGLTLTAANWVGPRHEYDVSTPEMSVVEIEQKYMQLFHYCYGPGYGFLFKDWVDYTSAAPGFEITNQDQTLTPQECNPLCYPITKKYQVRGQLFYRRIFYPKPDTLLIDTDAAYTVNWDQGTLEFETLPGYVRCGYEFYVPVRFKSDSISIAITGTGIDGEPIAKIDNITLMELLNCD